MKPGDLVRVISTDVPAPIVPGDLAILTAIDWDHRNNPEGIIDSRGRKITGRGHFFFPSKPEVQRLFQGEGRPLGVMLLFENFEVISEVLDD